MAAELVGGAVLSAFLQVAFDRLASPDVLDYFKKRRLNEMLVKKLNIMLLSINTVIDDAEEKQFANPNVKAWLDEVKDAVYDAEDVLDVIRYELTKCKQLQEAEIQTTITSKVRDFFGASVSSFDKEIESRMKQVLEILEFLESRKIVLGLKEGNGGVGVGSVRKVPTTSLVDEVGIYGRDDDKEVIVKWLQSEKDQSSNLIHLRYLDLSGTGIKKLPDSTCLLYNLQTLKLANCEHLDELPSDLHKLINLRHLDFRNTELKKIPQKLGKLKNLQVLTSFYVGTCSESNIKQLGELDLHGTLSILELQNVVYPMDALAAKLKDKKHLEELLLKWNDQNNDESQNERDVLEKLQPHQNLKKLSIRYYGGTRFPIWFSDDTLSNVVSLELENCKYCFLLPSLGLLPSLKSLSIKGFEGIVAIGPEFHGNDSTTVSFICLEILKFEEMANWEEWDCKAAFPCLKELHIKNCPKLKDHLPGKLPSLDRLKIKNCQQLVALVPWAPAISTMSLRNCAKVQMEYVPSSSLKSLRFDGPCMDVPLLEKIENTIANTCLERIHIADCPNLEFPLHNSYNFLLRIRIKSSCDSLRTFPLDLFPKLQLLQLISCSKLEMISVSEGHKHDPICLTKMQICDCPKFVSVGGFSAPRLEWCHIARLESLKSLPGCMNILFPSLKQLIIIDCPQLESFPQGGLPSKLRDLSIFDCPKLIASRMEWDLHNHSFLNTLLIVSADVDSFPEPGLLPPTLTSLYLSKCSSLTRLDYKGLFHITSLTELTLKDCPTLQCLPKEGLPTSLSYLEIRGNCPLLKQRCRKLKGEDWGKISHIPCVKIDDDIIT
ncbi:putative disease resistance RPP13-like protein 1 [Senna tora]|uniref:Putative disease resistance RPP13-like protein 1 n=1 Tax=Senna tora TaxID=362788 RepID=A0A834TPL2_9FABA|nr:putative disease resistance RPP13-like protein 1 [Senna tora]